MNKYPTLWAYDEQVKQAKTRYENCQTDFFRDMYALAVEQRVAYIKREDSKRTSK